MDTLSGETEEGTAGEQPPEGYPGVATSGRGRGVLSPAIFSPTMGAMHALEYSAAEIIRYAKGLLKAKEHVVSYCKHGITSARIEAFNRTISRTLHKTCGVSNPSYLFLKLRQYSLRN